MENKDITAGDKITGFIQKNRKGIFVFGGLIIALVIGLIVFLSVSGYLNKTAIAQTEELAERFDGLKWFLEDENYNDDVNALLKDLEAFAEKNRGVAASRAYSFIARIHSARGAWALCEEAWEKAAVIGNKTYLAPIALFNAAAAAEEQGNIDRAIEYLHKCVAHPFEFPAAPRAQFNIGRLYETQGNRQAAIEAYREILITWHFMPVWQNLARSKIIRLEAE